MGGIAFCSSLICVVRKFTFCELGLSSNALSFPEPLLILLFSPSFSPYLPPSLLSGSRPHLQQPQYVLHSARGNMICQSLPPSPYHILMELSHQFFNLFSDYRATWCGCALSFPGKRYPYCTTQKVVVITETRIAGRNDSELATPRPNQHKF